MGPAPMTATGRVGGFADAMPALWAASGAMPSGVLGGSASALSEFERLRHPQSSAGAEQHAPVSAFGVGSPQHAFFGAAVGVLVEREVPQQGLEAAVVLDGSEDMVGTGLVVVAAHIHR